MEHTVQAYLGRQSTEILEVLLRQYTEYDEVLMANTDVVLLILDELIKREGYSTGTSKEEAWERFLKFYADLDKSE